MTREPSLFLSPEFRRYSRERCCFSSVRLFHHLRPPAPEAIMERARMRVPTKRVVLDVPLTRCRRREVYLCRKSATGSLERRRVD